MPWLRGHAGGCTGGMWHCVLLDPAGHQGMCHHPSAPPLSRLILRKRWGRHRVLTPTGWEGVSEDLNSRRFSSELRQTLCSLSCSKCQQVSPRCITNLELWGDHAGFWETSHSLSRAPKWLLQSQLLAVVDTVSMGWGLLLCNEFPFPMYSFWCSMKGLFGLSESLMQLFLLNLLAQVG